MELEPIRLIESLAFGIGAFISFRNRWFLKRGFRILVLTGMWWGVLYFHFGRCLGIEEGPFVGMMFLYPNFILGFYYGLFGVLVLLGFLSAWILDVNVFGVLFKRVLFSFGHEVGQRFDEAQNQGKLIKEVEHLKEVDPLVPAPWHTGLNIVIGEAADIETGISSQKFFYIPKEGLYTNTIVFGSVGSGKTAGLLYPVLKQLIHYSPEDRGKQIAGLIFDLKGDFSDQVLKYLKAANRDSDFMTLSVDGEFIANPVSDKAMSGLVIGSLIQSLIEQVIGHEKAAFWKSQNMGLVESMTEGFRVAFDYVNLLYMNNFTTNIENGKKLIEYIRDLVGENGSNMGYAMVYQNIMPNTDHPWVLDSADGEVKRRVQVIPTKGSDPNLRKNNTTEHVVEFLESMGKLEQPETYWAYFREAYLFEKGFGNEDHKEDPERETYYQNWKKAFLNRLAGDKDELLEGVLDLFDISSEMVRGTNPFNGTQSAFSHDFYRYHVGKIHFRKILLSPLVRAILDDLKMLYIEVDEERVQQAECFIEWYLDVWEPFGEEMRGKVFGCVNGLVKKFQNPQVRSTFAVQMVTFYDHLLNPEKNVRRIFPSFDWLMTEGKWLCVNIPKATYHSLTDIICNLLKQQFQCVALQRTSSEKRKKHPEINFDREVVLMIDEYHLFATSGTTLDCDNNFFSVNRQSKVFFIGATQTIENLKNKFGEEAPVKQLLGCIRNKIFLGMEDPDSAKYAAEMVGKGLVYRVSKTLGENQTDSPYSVFAGDYQGENAGTSQSLNYQQVIDDIIQPKRFLELRSFQGICVCYDGDQRLISLIYLKPYWRPMNEAFHYQVREGFLKKTHKL